LLVLLGVAFAHSCDSFRLGAFDESLSAGTLFCLAAGTASSDVLSGIIFRCWRTVFHAPGSGGCRSFQNSKITESTDANSLLNADFNLYHENIVSVRRIFLELVG
jgi:hypothetical protein